MTGFVNRLKQKFSAKSLWLRVRDIHEKYYYYSRNIKRDYRWLTMFVVARFPLGRDFGAFFYRERYIFREKALRTIRSLTGEQITSSHKINHAENHLVEQELSLFKDIDSEVAIKSIEEQGYYLGLTLPESTIAELLDYAHNATLSIDGKKGLSFKYKDKDRAAVQYNRQILIGNYIDVNRECSAMQNLSSDPKLKEIATGYLGKESFLVRSQMGWRFIGDKQAYARKGEVGNPTVLFHYDIDDYRALKFFFYLTDVDSLSGFHRCVAGSHKKRSLAHYLLRSQSDREITNYYGEESIIGICGQAGFGFAEDPFCFHRGSPPVKAPRLMIQLEFALNDYGMW